MFSVPLPEEKKQTWGVTNTSKKQVGFERGRCLRHLLPALRKPPRQKNEWTGCPWNHSPRTMPTGLPAAEPQAAKMLHQDLCLNLLFPANPSPLIESPLQKGGDWCRHRTHYTIPVNTWLTYEVLPCQEKSNQGQKPIHSPRRTDYIPESPGSCMSPQDSPTSLLHWH